MRASCSLPLASLFALAIGGFACSSDPTRDAGGAPGAAATSPPIEIGESEPNDGPDFAGTQALGSFSDTKTLVLKGRLSSGGNDGTRYTGDYDVFSFDVAASGTIDISVDWSGTADVDGVLIDASGNVLGGDGAAAKPIGGSGALAPGKYAVALYSKDAPADWVATIKWVKPKAGAGGSCASPLTGSEAGGCRIALAEPANGTAITLPYRFGWTSNGGCSTPYVLQIYGNPPTPDNMVEWSLSTDPINAAAWTKEIHAGDLAGLRSDNGVYHWQVSNHSRASSQPGQTFTLSPTVCK